MKVGINTSEGLPHQHILESTGTMEVELSGCDSFLIKGVTNHLYIYITSDHEGEGKAEDGENK